MCSGQAQRLHVVGVARQDGLRQWQEGHFLEPGVAQVTLHQLPQERFVHLRVVPLRHLAQPGLEQRPLGLDAPMFARELLDQRLHVLALSALLRAGKNRWEQHPLFFGVVLEYDGVEEFQRVGGELACALCRRQQGGQLVQGAQVFDDAHMALREVRDGRVHRRRVAARWAEMVWSCTGSFAKPDGAIVRTVPVQALMLLK